MSQISHLSQDREDDDYASKKKEVASYARLQ